MASRSDSCHAVPFACGSLGHSVRSIRHVWPFRDKATTKWYRSSRALPVGHLGGHAVRAGPDDVVVLLPNGGREYLSLGR
jgi:hypothetical protein